MIRFLCALALVVSAASMIQGQEPPAAAPRAPIAAIDDALRKIASNAVPSQNLFDPQGKVFSRADLALVSAKLEKSPALPAGAEIQHELERAIEEARMGFDIALDRVKERLSLDRTARIDPTRYLGYLETADNADMVKDLKGTGIDPHTVLGLFVAQDGDHLERLLGIELVFMLIDGKCVLFPEFDSAKFTVLR
jgi:hypothetical protein